jgi:dTDP-4-amino-4,6-dideoxygalactose transaminase
MTVDPSSPANAAGLGLNQHLEERWPFYSDDEIAAAVAVLRSGEVNQWTGSDVSRFEAACTDRFGGGHGIAVANGSVALDLALLALEIGPGDEVVVTPRSFVASASCVLLAGATPVFADVDPESGNITAQSVELVITERTRAVIPVHLGGWPADMPAIMALAQDRGLKVIEDCAQAHGASIDGRSVGSFGDAAAFSFCQDKIISTGGEGGFVSFQDRDTRDWARSFKDHGKNWDKLGDASDTPGEFKWVHDQAGTNWRLTGPQAAIGLVQLCKLDHWNALRRQNAQIWIEALSAVPIIRIPLPPPGIRHAFYKLYLQIDAEEGAARRLRSEIMRRSFEEGLRVFSGSCPEIYLEGAFEGLPAPTCPNARRLSGTSLMVEVHPTLRQDLLKRRAERLSTIIAEVMG